MIQIRDNVFETNSSSTHSLCISKEKFDPKNIPEYLNITADEDFGWSQITYDTPEEKANYIFEVMCECGKLAEIKDFKNKIKKLGIKASYPRLVKNKWDCIDIRGYVDHAGEAVPFVHELLKDNDKLCRFLFNPKSVIYTGSDCVEDSDASCYVADSAENNGYTWGYDENGDGNETHHIHPMYDPEHYEYFFKGN